MTCSISIDDWTCGTREPNPSACPTSAPARRLSHPRAQHRRWQRHECHRTLRAPLCWALVLRLCGCAAFRLSRALLGRTHGEREPAPYRRPVRPGWAVPSAAAAGPSTPRAAMRARHSSSTGARRSFGPRTGSASVSAAGGRAAVCSATGTVRRAAVADSSTPSSGPSEAGSIYTLECAAKHCGTLRLGIDHDHIPPAAIQHMQPPPLTLTIRSSKCSQSLRIPTVVTRRANLAIKPHPSPLGHRAPQAVLGIDPQMQHQRPKRSRDTLKVARKRQQRSFIRTRPREHPRQIDPRPILNPHA